MEENSEKIILTRVFRLGKITLGEGWIRLQNRANDTIIKLSKEEAERWERALRLL